MQGIYATCTTASTAVWLPHGWNPSLDQKMWRRRLLSVSPSHRRHGLLTCLVCHVQVQAWKRHAQRQGITTSSGANYQKSYSDWVTENFSQRFKTFQIFDLAKRVMHYLSDLDCVNKFTEALGDHCDFQHEQLQTLPTMQNLHVLGKLILTLSAAYSLELLAEVFIVGSRYLAGGSANAVYCVPYCFFCVGVNRPFPEQTVQRCPSYGTHRADRVVTTTCRCLNGHLQSTCRGS